MKMADISTSSDRINKPRAPAASTSRAYETAYKTKIHQQPPPDRRQNATTTSISSSETIVEKLTIRRFKSRQLIRERKQQ